MLRANRKKYRFIILIIKYWNFVLMFWPIWKLIYKYTSASSKELVLFNVRPAWVQSIGCKSRATKAVVVVSLTKGVRGDAESERSERQTSEEHEFHIRLGNIGWVCITKESPYCRMWYRVNGADRWRERLYRSSRVGTWPLQTSDCSAIWLYLSIKCKNCFMVLDST